MIREAGMNMVVEPVNPIMLGKDVSLVKKDIDLIQCARGVWGSKRNSEDIELVVDFNDNNPKVEFRYEKSEGRGAGRISVNMNLVINNPEATLIWNDENWQNYLEKEGIFGQTREGVKVTVKGGVSSEEMELAEEVGNGRSLSVPSDLDESWMNLIYTLEELDKYDEDWEIWQRDEELMQKHDPRDRRALRNKFENRNGKKTRKKKRHSGRLRGETEYLLSSRKFGGYGEHGADEMIRRRRNDKTESKSEAEFEAALYEAEQRSIEAYKQHNKKARKYDKKGWDIDARREREMGRQASRDIMRPFDEAENGKRMPKRMRGFRERLAEKKRIKEQKKMSIRWDYRSNEHDSYYWEGIFDNRRSKMPRNRSIRFRGYRDTSGRNLTGRDVLNSRRTRGTSLEGMRNEFERRSNPNY